MQGQTTLFDLLIKNARVFNTDELPVTQDIAIKDGKIAARARDIEDHTAAKVIDATGFWAMPGLFDIHTHYDLELEVAPGLPESTRHGTTSVVIANCSLGLAFGNQRTGSTEGEVDPIVDCYARVENIPKTVLRNCAEKVDWTTPREYLQHLESLNLGPNVITMIPHSMLRIEAMGFHASIDRKHNETELKAMKEMLSDGLDAGYAGFSTDALPFHYLANQPNCHKTIPTQFADYKEIKALTSVVRTKESVWQATPPKDSPKNVIKMFLLSCARLHGKAMKTTVVAALDVASNRNLVRLATLLAKALNSRLLGGRFYMQALGARFKTWSDGAITPLAEEIPELRALNETDLEDRPARQAILADPSYVKVFKQMWMHGKTGFNLARIKRWLRLDHYAFDRDLKQMTVERCPMEAWEGLPFDQVFDRITNPNAHAVGERERELITTDFADVRDEADFVLQMLRTFDTDLSWSTVSANRDMQTVRKLIMDPSLLPGFNDSGAHLTNMAFYDANLRSLQLAAQGGEQELAYMVKRLTKDPADLFNVARGSIDVDDIADLILVDPKALADYDGEAAVTRVFRSEYQHEQLVNRSDGVVPLVVIGGHIAWQDNNFSQALGNTAMGALLKPKKAA